MKRKLNLLLNLYQGLFIGMNKLLLFLIEKSGEKI